MNVEQTLEIFYLRPIFELVAFFSVHTLTPKVYSVNEVRAPPPLQLSGQPNTSVVQPARHCPQRGV